ncbi:MAG: hypothetical protein MUE85_08275 [Microscillaceae bacterium]|jgi:tetratricopeptide (TPR) repeat protein|nr:hypothetical protein [Microscillaceae bacterium]
MDIRTHLLKLGLAACLLMAGYPLLAQNSTTITQKGMARLQNSGKKPLAGVQILFSGAKATESDVAGQFRLVFSGKSKGSTTIMERIYKEGYELVNQKELLSVTLTNNEVFEQDIILALKGTLVAMRARYFEISDSALNASLHRKTQELQQALVRKTISEQKFREELKVLNEKYENLLKQASELADKYARTNLDDVDPIRKEAIELFKAGKIHEAIQKYETINAIERIEKRIEKDKENKKGLAEDLNTLEEQTNLYVFEGQLEKAEALYDQLYRLDSANIEILWKVSDFYLKNWKFKKAHILLDNIISHNQINDELKATAFVEKGMILKKEGNLKESLLFYEKALKLFQTLHNKSKKQEFSYDMSICYERIGDIYLDLNNLIEAKKKFEISTQLMDSLVNIADVSPFYLFGFCFSKRKLGRFYLEIDENDNALGCFETSNKFLKILLKYFPNNLEINEGLASTYRFLGLVSEKLSNLEKSKEYFRNSIFIYEDLIKKNYITSTYLLL